MAVDAVLSPNFVEELLRLAFANRQFAQMVVSNVDVSNFPREMGACKAMLKVLADTMNNGGNLATFGTVEMTYPNNKDIQDKIKEVKNLKVPDVEPMVEQLEIFLRRQMFVASQREVVDIYNEGRSEEAMQLMEKRIREVNTFSLTDRHKFSRVYRDFYKNTTAAQMRAEDEVRRSKMPLGITKLDELTDGGIPRKDTALWIMRSGVGKSTALKFFCWYNTSIAHNHCLHFQLEGGVDEAVFKFDQMLAKTTYTKIVKGELSESTRKKVAALIKRAATVNSDIDVYASEEMLDMTFGELVQAIEDYKKEYGYYPDLITVDSLDLLLTGDSKKLDYDPNYLKYRLQRNAQRMKDIAVKYDCVVITACQTSDVPMEIWNDPSRVITRHNTEGDRTLVKPFSFVFTGNITMEESDKNIARIFCDKLRNYKNNGIIVRIPTDYEHGFFYDMTRSAQEEAVLDVSVLTTAEERRPKRRKSDSTPQQIKEVAPGVFGSEDAVVPKEENKESLKDYFNRRRNAI